MKQCKGRLFKTETLGTVDGPGIRTVFFLSGCALNCVYCHNIDVVVGEGAIVTPSDIVTTALRYRDYYGRRGGVTFSGGEPLVQAEFLGQCIELLRAEGINTCIDTSGVPLTDAAKNALLLADLILLDIKHAIPERVQEITRANAQDCYSALEFIKQNHLNCVIRQVIVQGVNDDEQSVLALKRLAEGIPIELLPYHTMGASKYNQLGIDYALKEAAATPQSVIDGLNALLKRG